MTEKNQQSTDAWQVDPQKYKEATDALFHREPELTPRLDKWTEDMPGIQEEQFAEPRLVRVNEINNTWLEIPRYENIMWGGGWGLLLVSIIVCPMPVYALLSVFSDFIKGKANFSVFILFLCLVFFLFSIFYFLFEFKNHTICPPWLSHPPEPCPSENLYLRLSAALESLGTLADHHQNF